MMESPEDLLRKIALGEDSYLEVKRVVLSGGRVTGPRADSLAEEIVAMANARGGVIVLGVDDKTHEIMGIELSDLDAVEAFARRTALDRIEPELRGLYTRRLLLPTPSGEQRAVLRLDIEQSLFVHHSGGRYLHRVGSEKREMSPAFLERMLAQRSQSGVMHFDERAVPETSTADFEMSLVERFRGSSKDAVGDLLRKLGMTTTRSIDGLTTATLAGALLGFRNPQQQLDHAFIQAVAYRGTTVAGGPGYQLDAADLHGPLDAQVIDACRFVARNMRIGADKQGGRRDLPQFDMTAVFEALVNAVAHRDYAITGSKIRLKIFADRLELYVPGGLVNSLELEDLPYQQNARNPVIASLLARLAIPGEIPWLETSRSNFMDRRGEGVPLVLERGTAIALRTPEYHLDGTSQLRLILFGRPECGATN